MATARDTDDLHSLLAEQHVELMAAQSLESDLDYAFRLQLEEAISASLTLVPSTSASTSSARSPPPPPSLPQQPLHDVVSPTFASLQSEELKKMEQELADYEQAKLEIRKTNEAIHRAAHDQKFAMELSRMPEEEWQQWGDNFEKPFGEGCSGSGDARDNNIFSLYFKGLVSEERINEKKVVLCGIGIEICDPCGHLIFPFQKPLIGGGMNKNAAEAKALIEGLNVALSLELKRVRIYCDCYPLYQYVTGRWTSKQRKVAALVNQVSLLQTKFSYCSTFFVARNAMTGVFKLARAAIDSQITRPVDSSSGKTVNETCVICLEDTDVGHMFSIEGCLHRYCFSCMKQHVEAKLRYGMLPKCPHEGCKSELKVDSCREFLTPKLVEILNQRIKEASIPATEKVYCPNPRCSTLMTKSEVQKYAKNAFRGFDLSGAAKCVQCHGLFCINCKVPWHINMTCNVYKMLNPNPPVEDVKLKSLASRNLWRQCVKCNHMIELSEGCYHMTCRCGYEFCYNCGAEWKNKRATCSCPLWDEDNILYDDSDDDSYEEEEDEDDESEYFESDTEWY
ncbi:uncharacterized protein LOC116141547 [Pistacia vera]|uniref:uncharacterized protein LOC116141547 n=1 Tax=Pistacia vera TaxID=55513 RepID=UPI00126371BC|nr:uncharacterized protein LOC116141547 [Pistacia vera]